MIWFKDYTVEEINSNHQNTMVSHCDIEITKISSDSIEAKMIVSDKIKQPFGIVHGGANCVLAETLGSVAGNLVCDQSLSHAVGLSITTNHIKAVRNGFITAKAIALHLGRKTHVWEIKTFNSKEELTSNTTLTVAIIQKLS